MTSSSSASRSTRQLSRRPPPRSRLLPLRISSNLSAPVQGRCRLPPAPHVHPPLPPKVQQHHRPSRPLPAQSTARLRRPPPLRRRPRLLLLRAHRPLPRVRGPSTSGTARRSPLGRHRRSAPRPRSSSSSALPRPARAPPRPLPPPRPQRPPSLPPPRRSAARRGSRPTRARACRPSRRRRPRPRRRRGLRLRRRGGATSASTWVVPRLQGQGQGLGGRGLLVVVVRGPARRGATPLARGPPRPRPRCRSRPCRAGPQRSTSTTMRCLPMSRRCSRGSSGAAAAGGQERGWASGSRGPGWGEWEGEEVRAGARRMRLRRGSSGSSRRSRRYVASLVLAQASTSC